MDPPPPNKRSFSKFLSEGWDKSFRRPPSPSLSPSSSQRPTRAPSPRPPSPSSLPNNQTCTTLPPPTGPLLGNEGQTGVQTPMLAPLPTPGASHPAPVGLGSEPPTIIMSSASVEFSNAASQAPLATPSAGPAHPVDHRATSKVWEGLVAGLKGLNISKRLPPPLQSAIDAFTPCLDVLEEVARNNHEYEELGSELKCVIDLLAQHGQQSSSARMTDSIANIARQVYSIEEQAKLIETKRCRGRGRRLMEANADLEELERHYRKVRSLFRQLQADANLSVWSIVNDQTMSTRLEGLMPVKLANYDSTLLGGNSRRTCTANTRTAILSELNDWSKNPEAPDLYWMNGMAGTGKTTIACSFCESLEESKQLAASFFCMRTVPECRVVTRIIPTLAYQLAHYSVPFRSALCEELERDPNAGSKNMMKQFERLLKNPLLKAKEAIPSDLVVAIDALDECDDMLEVELLLSILLQSATELPVKFFVTSRPEPEIYRRMLARVQDRRATLHLHEVEKSLVQADIELYLAEELAFMSPSPDQISELARRSGSLFIYAATLVRYIRPGRGSVDPNARLQSALAMTTQSNKMHQGIDQLYTAILGVVLDAEGLEDWELENVRLVLWTVICVQEPVEVDTLAVMTGLNDTQRVIPALEALRSVIHFSETNGRVSTLHASFPDFMFDKTRSKEYSCNLAEYSEFLTQQCFEVMKSKLRFNICKLESSFIPDSEVANFEERVKQAIAPPLWYSCRYWADHLRHSTYSDPLRTMLSDFLSVRLLFWMEVLNLKREIRMGAEMLLKAKVWLKVGVASPDLVKLAEDARNFVTSFCANPVSQCTPHIYISALPFCSDSSSVFQQYRKSMRGIINVSGSAMQRREAAPLARWKIGSEAHSVAYSPDGSCVAVGCGDGTVHIRSALDGTLVAQPLEGHTDWVWSVAYSPNGTHIVSGSGDKTVRVWSTSSGALIAGPFKGHTDSVSSVAYSPNGTHIVSGSGDKTIRVWRANDGALVAGPFEGHTGSVSSVAYSPDGIHIVSGSRDKTIRVWSANDGALLAGPFEGHTDSVWSVAYSPSGKHIISGSEDQTIRVWRANGGAPIARPLRGHTGSVSSVAYSPDGTHIVSGSEDMTIRVWRANDGVLIAGPFEGHTNSVWSAAYSPDGRHIVSGSEDITIRVWSTNDGAYTAGPFEGHTGSVRSVAYSPDGKQIVSGSDDKTIRVWSTNDCALVAGPLIGHTGWVCSVAYSPDGKHIASGSDDTTIRVWRANDGALIAGPFVGHIASVWSVAYSPDGTHIVSGSYDTIRVWRANDGTLIANPFKGHAHESTNWDWVTSVAYSPDGTKIVSGSYDNTFRIWRAGDGVLIAGPFQGNAGLGKVSVAYSPGGIHFVSGSVDQTIRVQCANDATPIAGPFRGHTDSVSALAYSPDGKHVVSGSEDQTIRVWSADGGAFIGAPFEEHTDQVLSVSYSPDGAHIVSGSKDKTIRVWSAKGGISATGSYKGRVNRHRSAPKAASPPDSCNIYDLRSVLTQWTVRDDGWVMDNYSRLLFWVPWELAAKLPSLDTLLVIYPHYSLRIDFEDVIFGELWHQCYKPE